MVYFVDADVDTVYYGGGIFARFKARKDVVFSHDLQTMLTEELTEELTT